MIREPRGLGSILHMTSRGVRGTNIVIDNADRSRFIRSLFYLNDTYADPYWHSIVSQLPPFTRPTHWPEREPLVRILAWTLLSNHFHILAQETREDGTTKLMQRLGGSMSKCYNAKYKEKGSLFQGAYHARAVSEDAHLNYLAFYILVKNVLEMYPRGLAAASVNFDDAWEWAKRYPYSSFRDIISGTASPILDDEDNLIAGVIGTGDDYKQEARELLNFYIASHGGDFKDLMLEPW